VQRSEDAFGTSTKLADAIGVKADEEVFDPTSMVGDGDPDKTAEIMAALQAQLDAAKGTAITLATVKKKAERKAKFEASLDEKAEAEANKGLFSMPALGADEGDGLTPEYAELVNRADGIDFGELKASGLMQILTDTQNDDRPLVLWIGYKLNMDDDEWVQLCLDYICSSLDELTEEPFSVVYVHSDPAPGWGFVSDLRNFLPRKFKKNLCRLTVVDASFAMKCTVALGRPFISDKFWDKLSYVDNVEELCVEYGVSREFWPEGIEKPAAEPEPEVVEGEPEEVCVDKSAEEVLETAATESDADTTKMWCDTLFASYDTDKNTVDMPIESFAELLRKVDPELSAEGAKTKALGMQGVVNMSMSRRGFNQWFAESFAHLKKDELDEQMCVLLATAPMNVTHEEVSSGFSISLPSLFGGNKEEDEAKEKIKEIGQARLEKIAEIEKLQMEIEQDSLEAKKRRLEALKQDIRNDQNAAIGIANEAKVAAPAGSEMQAAPKKTVADIKAQMDSDLKTEKHCLAILKELEILFSDKILLMKTEHPESLTMPEVKTAASMLNELKIASGYFEDFDLKAVAEKQHRAVDMMFARLKHKLMLENKREALVKAQAEYDGYESGDDKDHAKGQLLALELEVEQLEAENGEEKGFFDKLKSIF